MVRVMVNLAQCGGEDEAVNRGHDKCSVAVLIFEWKDGKNMRMGGVTSVFLLFGVVNLSFFFASFFWIWTCYFIFCPVSCFYFFRFQVSFL